MHFKRRIVKVVKGSVRGVLSDNISYEYSYQLSDWSVRFEKVIISEMEDSLALG